MYHISFNLHLLMILFFGGIKILGLILFTLHYLKGQDVFYGLCSIYDLKA